MSYPQPSSNAPVLNGQNFFRLNTPLVSPGDIYESEQSAMAFAIGPQSDLANIAIDYFDESITGTYQNSVQISTERHFVGDVRAENSTYQPSGVPGRVLIRPTDLWYNSVDLAAIVGSAVDSQFFIPPQLDVIEYFTEQPSIVPQRSDKEFYYQGAKPLAGTEAKVGILMPYYGRKSASYLFVNPTAHAYNIGLCAVNFAIDKTTPAYRVGNWILDPGVATVGAGAQTSGVFKFSTMGSVDAILLYLNNASDYNFIWRMNVSDTLL